MIYATNTRYKSRPLKGWHAFDDKNLPMKSLCGLKRIKEHDHHKFSTSSSTMDLVSMCRICAEIIRANEGFDLRTFVTVKGKRCPKCDTVKASGLFYSSRLSKTGLKSYCKECCVRMNHIWKERKEARCDDLTWLG
jgi:hypothetical protein